MTTHYDTLGIPPDADADTIKQAFRRVASKAHPDRGGDTARMQAVNRAHGILGDPEKRAAYDAAGYREGPSLQDMADQLLRAAFEAAINDDAEPISTARKKIRKTCEAMKAEKAKGEAVLARLKRCSGWVKTRDGSPNLVQSIIDGGIARVTEKLAQADEAIKVSDMALAALDAYETSEEVPPSMPQQYDPTTDRLRDIVSAFAGVNPWAAR